MKRKKSPTDVIPTEVLKNCVDVFSMALSHLANLSFASGVFPRAFKIGHVSPLLKKKGLDIKDPANYRPITNLSTISKILEKLALARIKSNVHASENFGSFQSAYRAGHSTETALLRVTNDLNTSMDKKACNTLLSLDISAAFDTIDHDVLVRRLNTDFGITDSASKWFQSSYPDVHVAFPSAAVGRVPGHATAAFLRAVSSAQFYSPPSYHLSLASFIISG